MPEYTRPFTKLRKDDMALAGGKGASLGEMTHAGTPVPPGFVILANSFDHFIDQAGLRADIEAILAKVNHQEIHTVEQAAAEIQAMILNADMPKEITVAIRKSFAALKTPYVAVRSSATAEDSSTAAWAGQLESYLNTTRANLLVNVKKCWASLFTPRAIFYRFEKKLHTQSISVAVVVQKMVASEVSGIGFSVHPVTQDRNQMIIEAGLGLGEAIVSGQITPDSYVVTKTPFQIEAKQIATQTRGLFRANKGGNKWQKITMSVGGKQVLSDQQILELGRLIIKIEKHYGFPVDIEWALEKGKIYIVQSRPITTLSSATQAPTRSAVHADLPQPKSDQYVRLFRVTSNSIPFILSDLFAGYYKELKCLLSARHGEWISFIPVKTVEQTRRAGIKLIQNQRAFNWYIKSYNTFISRSKKFFVATIRKPTLTKNDVQQFLEQVSDIWRWYSKTEFFYTDGIFQLAKAKPTATLRGNIKRLEEIKKIGRQYLNTVVFQPSYVRALMKKLSKQFSVSLTDLECYGVNDMVALFNGQKLGRQTISDRQSAFAMIGDGYQVRYLIGDEAESMIRSFSTADPKKLSTMRGVTAHPGQASGHVRLIPTDYYLDFRRLKGMMMKMQQGEILVAETTSPEMMPACKKAAAIITEQGGMLSHAAIVSRELGIPCVVQVQNALTVLKDGDLVEVDADRGLVQKLDPASWGNALVQEFQRETSISLFQVWLMGHTGLYELLRLDQRAARQVYGDYDHGIVRGFTPPGNIDSIKKALHELSVRNITTWLRRYLENFRRLQKNPRLTFRPEFLTELVTGFVLCFIAGDMAGEPFQPLAATARKKTERLFPILATNLRRKAKLKRLTNLYTYDELIKSSLVPVNILAARRSAKITSAGVEAVPMEAIKKWTDRDRGSHIYKKVMNRSMSVMLCQCWEEGERDRLPQTFGGSIFFQPLFIARPEWGMAVYYDFSDPRQAYDEFIQYCYRHRRILPGLRRTFEQNCRAIIRLAARSAEKDFPRLVQLLTDIWPMVVYSNTFGSFIPERVKPWLVKDAEVLRRKYDRVIYLGDAALVKMARSKVPANLRRFVPYLTIREIMEQEFPSGHELQRRRRGMIYFRGQLHLSATAVFIKNHNIILEDEARKTKSGMLKGFTAEPGRATGRVKVIYQADQIGKIQSGDILVTPMTTPNFLPAMKKAAAFVTDEGGITCHAAIVARELKKPCVIGTLNATKILKDGDLVEVDAVHGQVKIVKIVNRKK